MRTQKSFNSDRIFSTEMKKNKISFTTSLCQFDGVTKIAHRIYFICSIIRYYVFANNKLFILHNRKYSIKSDQNSRTHVFGQSGTPVNREKAMDMCHATEKGKPMRHGYFELCTS